MNEIVGAKYFTDAPTNSLMVTSLFYTIQGEGPLMGTPAIFIRLSKCNLACSFCDAFFDQGDYMTFDEIIELSKKRIDDFYQEKGQEVPFWAQSSIGEKSFSGVNLVVTGGEPTLQDNLSDFLFYCKEWNIFKDLQIESNGIRPLPVPEDLIYVVSPKCKEKNGVSVKYLTPHPDVMKRASCFKFVVEHDPESLYNSVPDWAENWMHETGREIFVSPMNVYNDLPQKAKQLRNTGVNSIDIDVRSTVDEVVSFWEEGLLDMGENQKNHEHAAKLCMEKGFRLNLQMHLYASLA